MRVLWTTLTRQVCVAPPLPIDTSASLCIQKRDKTRVITYRCPNNCAVQVKTDILNNHKHAELPPFVLVFPFFLPSSSPSPSFPLLSFLFSSLLLSSIAAADPPTRSITMLRRRLAWCLDLTWLSWIPTRPSTSCFSQVGQTQLPMNHHHLINTTKSLEFTRSHLNV